MYWGFGTKEALMSSTKATKLGFSEPVLIDALLLQLAKLLNMSPI